MTFSPIMSVKGVKTNGQWREKFSFFHFCPYFKGSPYYTVHLQKTHFAASNHLMTHQQAYFVKISSKHQIYRNKQPNHPPAPATPLPMTKPPATHDPPANLPATADPRLGHSRPKAGSSVTHAVTHGGRDPSLATFFISGQTQPENT
jgi:hypothetical protein